MSKKAKELLEREFAEQNAIDLKKEIVDYLTKKGYQIEDYLDPQEFRGRAVQKHELAVGSREAPLEIAF